MQFADAVFSVLPCRRAFLAQVGMFQKGTSQLWNHSNSLTFNVVVECPAEKTRVPGVYQSVKGPDSLSILVERIGREWEIRQTWRKGQLIWMYGMNDYMDRVTWMHRSEGAKTGLNWKLSFISSEFCFALFFPYPKSIPTSHRLLINYSFLL